ncbi:hypothetical protein Dsin_018902 [Dipteronia sinensis]|uniref:Reverse transcriptase zinc-binding domain-containing protein n=1 Tax=Dipteronia sinensis TaxID=43782 RepID=A0AAE0A7P3_9ROSI|nr:hypothetical protein Dsin_018902 [Dipteronia sinensis]
MDIHKAFDTLDWSFPCRMLQGEVSQVALETLGRLIGENPQWDFWHENWLGVPILELLRILDYLACHLRARVSNFIQDGRWVLDDCFQARFSDFYFQIGQIVISPVANSLVWAHSQNSRVSCKAAYSQFIRDYPQVPWWRDVWYHFILPYRSALTKHLLLNRLPIEDHLCRFGFQLASRCSVSGVSSESADHLFLQCPMEATFWEAAFWEAAFLEVVFSAFQQSVSTNSWNSYFLQAMLVSF